ncbi:transcriptional repressor NrdR [Lujinxingia vulgaris]|uniref:Transcriptional repressor NrdR n=1 Tax=Lujinxingia vulgaris TaxID=2600176 RepID=A0A5C6XGU0_9DELT|nr:transcriptional regulator NrdR [Lujinxingia vulgaris]TXD39084.1 transcriptional repressor NrdR [Lujinxingia vulgaris]
MRCPFCGHLEDRVVDSRQARGGAAIRRRRECLQCERRYTTYEQIEEVFPQVVKRDETREEYDRQKIQRGIRLACSKRPISVAQIEEVVDRFEERMLELGAREVTSDWIGSTITTELRDLDPVAYIRFASVYRAFNNIDEFLDELRELDRFERDRHPSPAADDSDDSDEPATKD